jgi:hypothetical protein
MRIGHGLAPRSISRRLWRAGKLTFSAGAIRYAVKTQGPGMALRGAKVTLLHMLDGTLGVRFKDRDLAFAPFNSLPVPPRSKTIRPPTPASTRSSRETRRVRPEGPARAVENGLARYGAVGGALRQAAIHPHSTRSPLSETGNLNLAG